MGTPAWQRSEHFFAANELNGVLDAKAGLGSSAGVRCETLEVDTKLFEDHAMSSEDAFERKDVIVAIRGYFRDVSLSRLRAAL